MARTILASLLLAAAFATAAGAGARPATRDSRPSIAIVSARATAVGIVRLTVRISGWKMCREFGDKGRPDGGHWAIYVDGVVNNLSTSPTRGNTEPLAPGTHRIGAALRNVDGSPCRACARSQSISVRVV